MKAKIYKAPEHIKLPEIDFSRIEEYLKKDQEYIDKLRHYCKTENPNDKYAGVLLRFPMADGAAQYMVFRSKPIEVFWIELGDAWDSPYADKIIDLKEIKRQISWDKFWKKSA